MLHAQTSFFIYWRQQQQLSRSCNMCNMYSVGSSAPWCTLSLRSGHAARYAQQLQHYGRATHHTSHVTRHTSHVTRHTAACDGCPCTHLLSWCWILVRDSHCECNLMYLSERVLLVTSSSSSSLSFFYRYHFNQPNPAPPSIDFVKDVHTFALASRFKAKKYNPKHAQQKKNIRNLRTGR